MEFRILGPLELRAGDRALQAGGVRQRRVLAALLLAPNRVVPLDRLIEAAWDGDAPATARRQVQNRVAALRATLTRAGGFIDTAGSGYRLRIGPGELDSLVFDELVARGQAAADPAVLRAALALWRGSALAGLGGALLAREAAALEEKRLDATEECLALELAAGEHGRLVAELQALVDAHPLRERLVGQLMTALYRCGRSDEALAAYRSLASRLSDELGIDPSPDLRRLGEEVALRPVPTAATRAPAVVTPRQLPAEVPGFTGRITDLAALDRLSSDSRTGRAVIISAIAGTAGVGKTALAVHWAHRVRHKFPDGQLYVNLRAYAQSTPVRPIDALGGFLRALGVAGERVPADLDEAAAMYRELLADQRVLVVLDNAASADQTRPLLPSGSGSLALVTSRDALTGLGGHGLTLDVLDPAEAIGLLARVLGEDRVAAEPEAAAELARLCAYLPLALRIAAAHLIDGNSIDGNSIDGNSIDDYAARMVAGDPLGLLAMEGDQQAAVRAAFDLSYAALPAPAQRMFRLLGVMPGPDISVEAAASLAAVEPGRARRLLGHLAAAHLIDEHAPGRYTFHDLLRAYATDLARAERHVAVHRVLDHYLHTACAATLLLNSQRDPIVMMPIQPGAQPRAFADEEAATAWLSAESAVLIAAVDQAAEAGFDTHAWQLPWAIATFFTRRGYWRERASLQQTALAAARRIGDGLIEAKVRDSLAFAYGWLGRFEDAYAHLERAFDVYRELGDHAGQAHTHHTYSRVLGLAGRDGDALAHSQQSLELFRVAGHRVGQARALNSIGWDQAVLGNHREALTYCQEALALFQELGDRDGEAATWDSVAYTHHHLGDHEQAVDCYLHAVALFEELGDQHGVADTLGRLGDTHHAAGNRDAALDVWRRSVAIFDVLRHPDGDQVRVKLRQFEAA